MTNSNLLKKKSNSFGVFYSLIHHKKINGTLFYCFEHFVFLNKFKKTNFYIKDCSEEDLKTILKIFKEKYDYDSNLDELIFPISSIREIYRIDIEKALFLDIRSLNEILLFLKCKDIYSFVNEEGILPESNKNIKYYGIYDYQKYDVEQMLQINFDIFKKIDNKFTDAAFVSLSKSSNYKEYFKIKERKIIVKSPNEGLGNIFELVDALYFLHNSIDTNNRAIPEAFFYNKRIEIFHSDSNLIDSVVLRYEDCLKGNLRNYWLDENNKIIRDMIE